MPKNRKAEVRSLNNIAMARAVQAAVKPKFYGNKVLKSKVVTHYPEHLEREYMRVTNAYMAKLNKVLAEHLPVIRKAIDAERESMRHDDNRDILTVIDSELTRIAEGFEKIQVSSFLETKLLNMSVLARNHKIREWKRIVRQTLGINIMDDYYKGEFFRHSLQIWADTNVQLISSIPNAILTYVSDIVKDGYISGKTNTAIGKAIQEKYGIERRHAQFIARDQMAKLNAEITQAQQKDAGIEEYVWSTSDDIRVRERHKELDGTRQKWSEPPVVDKRTGRREHPGQDYNCRCVALPVFNLTALNLPWEGKDEK